MAAQNICFYSKNCDWSKAFLKEVATTPFKNQFTFICVDKDASGKRPNLPDWLKKVPTLIIKGEKEPIKTDAEVMNWLYLKKMALNGPGGGGGAGGAGPIDQEPQAWLGNEMGGGLRDDYTFIDGSQEGFLSHNFEMLTGPGVRTSSDIPGAQGQQVALERNGRGEGKSQKADLFDKQMQDYMQNRSTGVPQARPRQ